ncbi:MAG: 3-deoxy-manno-octulosonate cytidylyltransferase [Anaeroplasmataceae bacterium]|nr:3-deoxy-manno-octulosonate cytidylyltransferase [Anaeroplasmataceae bacterium]
MKIVAVIPARYKSSRFPGKPLADICGKPMVWWVYQEAKKVKEYDRVIVATESKIIADRCHEFGMEVMLTSDMHPTGTDRVAEVAQKIEADLYVIIMGDEPLLTARDERKLIQSISNRQDADAVMLTERFKNPIDVANMTTIKLAINDKGYLIFMSRAIIPYPKEALGYSIYKNVGCYALRKEALDFYLKTKPGNIEKAEGIELLRLIENHKKVFTVEIESESMAVDTQKDLERIQAAFAQNKDYRGQS